MDKISIKGVKNIIVVASGKGGVGKSMVAANLAITLANKGYKTALVDADIYGPSIPKMFGLENYYVGVRDVDGEKLMIPMEQYGVKFNSIGFMVESGTAVIWRAPLASSALAQLFAKTDWGEIDYMVVDFPPGTGDIQISAIQQFRIKGAVIVTTPQVLAVNDARKGAEMFSPEKMNVHLFGIVENMSWFSPKQHPEEQYFLFGKGGGEKLAKEFNTELLAQIPLVQEVGESAEQGANLMEQGNPALVYAFNKIADEVVAQIKTLPVEPEPDPSQCKHNPESCQHSSSCNHDCSSCAHHCKH